MSLQGVPSGFPISQSDWKQLLPSVEAFRLWQDELNTKLTKRVEELAAKLEENSSNSNRSPSSDSPNLRGKRESKGTGKPGAKAGHKEDQPALLLPTKTELVSPKTCDQGLALRKDASIKRFGECICSELQRLIC